MSDFVKEDNVFVNQDAESREAVLRFIADRAAELGITDDADAVYEAFLAREDMGETGMTDGFAVPHAKDASIKKAAVIVFKSSPSMRWNFCVTGTVHFQLSPNSPRSMLPSQPKKPSGILLSRP